MPARRTPKQSRLLAALPAAELVRLARHLECVPLPLGAVIYESGGEQGHVYFPASGIVSLLYVMNDGAAAEIAVVGSEGAVGIALFMGGETTPSRAVVQSAGSAWRVAAAPIKAAFARGGAQARQRRAGRGGAAQAPVRPRRRAAARAAALHAGAAHSEDANRGVQPPPPARAAALPLAAAQPRSPAVERGGHDAAADRQH